MGGKVREPYISSKGRLTSRHSFYRDTRGQATLKDHGFMLEWANRAGKLVFQEAEELLEDNVVTFANLALFWYSQGSWRKGALHKGELLLESH